MKVHPKLWGRIAMGYGCVYTIVMAYIAAKWGV